jgi:YidC/Oxa1 family membrane protein insertase
VDRRVFLALVLFALVIIVPSLIWPPKPVPHPTATDTVAAESVHAQSPAPQTPESTNRLTTIRLTSLPVDTVWITTPLYRLGISTRGGTIVSARLSDYKSFAAGDSGHAVELVPAGRPFLAQRIAVGSDTLSLTDLSFAPSARVLSVSGEPAALTLTANRGPSTLTLTYRFRPDEYRIGVAGQVTGLGAGGAQLLVGLGDGLRNTEADSIASFRDYAVVTKAAKTEKHAFASVKEKEPLVLDGPFEWAGIKSKYFLLGALAIDPGQQQFGGAVAVGGARPDSVKSLFGGKSGLATEMSVSLTLPTPPAGDFRYAVYLGPLEHRRLAAIGHDLDDANPYGWAIFRPIIRPVSIAVTNLLLLGHEHLNLAYGWLLIFFGVLIRVLLWPLNSRAMASSLRMQAVGPLLKEVQTKYKNDPERQQKETLKIYKEHNVNPLGGCLPMLIPWPVLLALYFVFQYTIELRGSPFLWLPDLSRFDPYFILPVVMGVSMYALSKIGQRGMPPNPQASTMLYMMPAMMTFIFLKLSSGLNLYYLVSNLFSLPQQWMISQKRLKDQGKRVASS